MKQILLFSAVTLCLLAVASNAEAANLLNTVLGYNPTPGSITLYDSDAEFISDSSNKPIDPSSLGTQLTTNTVITDVLSFDQISQGNGPNGFLNGASGLLGQNYQLAAVGTFTVGTISGSANQVVTLSGTIDVYEVPSTLNPVTTSLNSASDLVTYAEQGTKLMTLSGYIQSQHTDGTAYAVPVTYAGLAGLTQVHSANFAGGFNVTHNYAGINIMPGGGGTGDFGNGTHSYDLTISTQVWGNKGANSGTVQLLSHTAASMASVPEPTSVLLWAGTACSLVMVRGGRRLFRRKIR